ncbi:MAG: cytoplasmic protein [Hyphomicrobiaceae bacterium]
MPNVFDLPDDHWLRVAHDKSIYHRREIEASLRCGCFYCEKIFRPADIKDWTDTECSEIPGDTAKQTALCPHCGIDSVIGDRSGFEITAQFLRDMNKAWF